MRGRHRNHAKGSSHPRWSDERMMSEHGYIKIRVGKDHPLADPNGYAYEHLVVWVSAGREAPGDGDVLHHENEDQRDNRLGNLKLMPRVDHNRLHVSDRRDSAGRFTESNPGA